MILQYRNGILKSGRQAQSHYRKLSEYHYSISETQEARKRCAKEKTEPKSGLRTRFFKLIEEQNLGIEDAINKFIGENPAFKEKDVIKWLSEDLKKRKFSEDLLKKIAKFLDDKQKEIEDEGR